MILFKEPEWPKIALNENPPQSGVYLVDFKVINWLHTGDLYDNYVMRYVNAVNSGDPLPAAAQDVTSCLLMVLRDIFRETKRFATTLAGVEAEINRRGQLLVKNDIENRYRTEVCTPTPFGDMTRWPEIQLKPNTPVLNEFEVKFLLGGNATPSDNWQAISAEFDLYVIGFLNHGWKTGITKTDIMTNFLVTLKDLFINTGIFPLVVPKIEIAIDTRMNNRQALKDRYKTEICPQPRP